MIRQLLLVLAFIFFYVAGVPSPIEVTKDDDKCAACSWFVYVNLCYHKVSQTRKIVLATFLIIFFSGQSVSESILFDDEPPDNSSR